MERGADRAQSVAELTQGGEQVGVAVRRAVTPARQPVLEAEDRQDAVGPGGGMARMPLVIVLKM